MLEKEQRKTPFSGSKRSVRLEKAATAPGDTNKNSISADTAIRAGKAEGSSSQSEKLGGNLLLSVGDVMSASLSQAALWASTRDVIRAVVAAACRPGGNSCSTPETTQRSTAESAGAGCAAARRAACALLERAFGNVPAGEEEETSQSTTTGIGGKEASTALDWWYEEVCSAMAPCGGGIGIGIGIGAESPLLLQAEGLKLRLLLEEMLEISALRAAFVKRGLARYLADALRVGSLEMKRREVRSAWRHNHARRAPDIEAPPSCGTSKLPNNSDPDLSCACCAEKTRRITRPRQDGGGADRKASLPPWWLLFGQGRRGERGGSGHEHGERSFSDTLKNLGGSADGAGAEADGRSCQTALDEIFAPERGKEERGAETSREDDDPNDGNSLGSAGAGAGGRPVSATAKQRECREREEEPANGGTVGVGVNSTKAGRVAPPMLRLDALGSILDTEEGASARLRSSHAVASLSAASTRAASEHLVRSSGAANLSVRFLSWPFMLPFML